MTIRHIIGILLFVGAIACFGLSQKESLRLQFVYTSKGTGSIPMGPERDVPLSSFERGGYAVGGIILGLGAIYCFILPWLHRKKDDADTRHSA